jgi:hypothetical protein
MAALPKNLNPVPPGICITNAERLQGLIDHNWAPESKSTALRKQYPQL